MFVAMLRVTLAGAIVVALPHLTVAADQKAALAKIKAQYQAAAAAYDDGDLAKAQAQLQQALKVADDNGVGSQKLVAQADTEDGDTARLRGRGDQGLEHLDRFGKRARIAGAIGEENPVWLVLENGLGGRAAGNHRHAAARFHQGAKDVPLHPEIQRNHVRLAG